MRIENIFAAIAISALAVTAGCGQGGAQEKAGAATPAAPPAVAVTVVEAALRTVPIVFEAVGRTEGSREIQVRARVSGIIEAQLYREGDAVQSGAALFRIERAPYEIALAEARAVLAQETARLALARQELERLQGLADRRAISRKEADQAASTASQTEAAVQLAQARLRQAELDLSYTTVRASIHGVSGRALQSVGTLVQPSADSALLTTITRSDPIWVRFALSEAEYARLRRGDAKAIEVGVDLADGSAYPQRGRLNFAGSTVEGSTGTVQMRAELPNPDGALLAGQFVPVRVHAGMREAIVVPQAAVMQSESGRFVYVAGPDGKATARPIRAGAWQGGDWVVLEGLKAGEQVIVDNLGRVRPGVPVQVKKAG
ncbi:MAG: efflux RND transporter periplasmic adaptor subunit [Burkholderiales bacterium]